MRKPTEFEENMTALFDLLGEVRIVLESLRRQHDICEDGWYSCPKSSEGCCDDRQPKDQCNCGADTHNKKIDKLLSKLDPNYNTNRR